MLTVPLLTNAAAPVVGPATRGAVQSDLTTKPDQSYQATVTGTGAVSATVVIEFSNDQVGWLPGLTFMLSGTTSVSEGDKATQAPWAYRRANLTAISGTNASVNVTMGL